MKAGRELIVRLLLPGLLIPFLVAGLQSCGGRRSGDKGNMITSGKSDFPVEEGTSAESRLLSTMVVIPSAPRPGEPFRIIVTGGRNILKAKVVVSGLSDNLSSLKSRTGEGLPFWRVDDFPGSPEGNYTVTLTGKNAVTGTLGFDISAGKVRSPDKMIWKNRLAWDPGMEALYAAWVNALFSGCDEGSSWAALHEVTQNRDRNFLYNSLSLGEDDPESKNRVVMEPDCADNPFFLRAYFSWKLGLPFGYHLCDRGYIGHNPKTGRWITNETVSQGINPVQEFNLFLRKMMDGVHSGTARTALEDENSDYYPVPLEKGYLRPGTVFADPYGHTLILTGWIPQTGAHPGGLLSVDAQPDGTVGVKRFWKGNFLFNTEDVIGEPGFKAFRPIVLKEGFPGLLKNEMLTGTEGFVPFSLQQKDMAMEDFYHTMDRLINPEPPDPETAMTDLIQALYEQLRVRVTSVGNGEVWFKSHPGSVIPMPSNAAGIFQTGGVWEDFSTPNRDLRLLIALDAVITFPDRIGQYPGDYDIPRNSSAGQVTEKLRSILDQKGNELFISYTRTDGSTQKLTIGEILKRRDALEMAYNPNDGVEIRWGAPENSDERSTCRRHAPLSQRQTMEKVRVWFRKRLHPPT